MHSNSILCNSLLDIIFENRNKNYGAYVLRRDYNKTLARSLLTVLALVTVLCWWQTLLRKHKSVASTFVVIPDLSTTPLKSVKYEVEKKKARPLRHASATPQKNNPVIVKDIFTEEVIPFEQLLFSDADNDAVMPPSEGPGGGGGYIAGLEMGTPLKPLTPLADSEVPVISPEVVPQYPGGVSGLIKFLQKNLNAPRELEDTEEISVKIRFVVNSKGNLSGFTIIETGGEPFDNEVIRVLKKMPQWIAGRTAGRAVATYYIVPVKFTVTN